MFFLDLGDLFGFVIDLIQLPFSPQESRPAPVVPSAADEGGAEPPTSG